MANYKYLDDLLNGESTRARSKKQESKIARALKGSSTINSGATLSQNDVFTDYCEVEAKITGHKSFSVTLKDWFKLKKKSKAGKIPIFVIEFENENQSMAVLDYNDLLFLIKMANEE